MTIAPLPFRMVASVDFTISFDSPDEELAPAKPSLTPISVP